MTRDEAVMEPLETLASFKTRLEAERARRWLEDEGVASQLTHVGPGNEGVTARLSDAAALRDVGDVRVEVGREDLDRARAILARETTDDDLPTTAITARPDQVTKRTDSKDQPDSEKDGIARRACLAAVIGLVILPPIPQGYSLCLLLSLSQAKGTLNDRGRRYFILAIIIDALVFGVILLFCSGFFTAEG